MRATGVGSVPGTDIAEWARFSFGTFEQIAFWPELPQRGSASQMIGRASGLVDLPISLGVDGWRLDHAVRGEQRRAAQTWRDDMDILAEIGQGYAGALKVGITGPWTLAACVRGGHPTMDHALADQGACRELAEALGVGLTAMIARLGGLLDVPVVIQLDEPMIGTILAGGCPGYSGLQCYRRPPDEEIVAVWGIVWDQLAGLDRVGGRWLHSCGTGMEIRLAEKAGFDGISLDLRHLEDQVDALGIWLDAGRTLGLGAVPTHEVVLPRADRVASAALGWLRRLAMDPQRLISSVVLTPACGLGTWPQTEARTCLTILPQAASIVAEEIRY